MRQGTWTSRIFRWLGLAAVLVSLAYFVRFAVRNAGLLPRLRCDAATVAGLAGCLLIYLLAVLLVGARWLILLRSVGEPAQARLALPLFAVSEFGKYIPGNVAHLAGRVVLAVQAGMVRERVLATMALEIAWGVLSGVLMAGSALTLAGAQGLAGELVAPPTIVLAGVTLAALLVPFAGAALLRHLPERVRTKVPGLSQVQAPKPLPLVVCFLIGCVYLLLLGAVPAVLNVAVFGGKGGQYLTITGVFALAWVAGFITPGAPAGLGVRDAIMMAGLTPLYGAGSALAVTVVMRVVTSAGDAIAFLAGMAARAGQRARPMQPPAN
jgi:hypothetical protein